ncbi:MAG TPA: hypothetical protein VMF58_15835 [Rhizomicrobium sp.]|nr:hypothetical protein [Rhizomicrobium sp.]
MRRLSIVALAAAVLCSSQAMAISTRHAWDGSQSVGPFGCPDSSTFGQVITLPKFKSEIKQFEFLLALTSGGKGAHTIRGELYAWDPVNMRPTGNAIYESPQAPLKFGDSNFHRVTFYPFATVQSNKQYVAFATVDKDYDACQANPFTMKWAAVPDTTYAKGEFVYLDDVGDWTEWEITSWSTANADLAFKVVVPH